jgi:hypothetical protein
MPLPKIFFVLIFMSSLLSSCGKGGGGSGSSQKEVSTASLEGVLLDSGLSPSERTSVNQGFDSLQRYEIDGRKIRGFSDIFGGNQSSNVVSYLKQRVHYVISNSTPSFSRLENAASSLNDGVLASNSSVFYWYIDEYSLPQGGARYVINGVPQEINSSRIGVIQLGDIFAPQSAAVQAITLVHEARHSDCPNGALRSDIVNFAQSSGSAVPKNLTCGQLHSGLGDGFAWGAYAADFIYSLAIYNTCTNCTETEKQQALINANEVQQRAFDIVGTVKGNYGPPNMGNSTEIKDQL